MFLFDEKRFYRIEKPTFWEEWGTGIIISVCVLLFIAGCLIAIYLYDRYQNRKPLFVECNGRSVDPLRVRRITLITQDPIEVVKGDLFIAPAPSRDGFSFEGWFYDTAFTRPYYTKRIRKDITLYPKWTKHS